jgi:hypothetical protein
MHLHIIFIQPAGRPLYAGPPSGAAERMGPTKQKNNISLDVFTFQLLYSETELTDEEKKNTVIFCVGVSRGGKQRIGGVVEHAACER